MKVRIKHIRPETASDLINELDLYQASLYPPQSNHLDSLETLGQSNVVMVGAVEESQLLAIGAVKMFKHYGEIKRVYVPRTYRDRGLAKRIMTRLEKVLVDRFIFQAKLETGILQPEAIGLYQSLGYKNCRPFGSYQTDPLSVFMSKDLTERTRLTQTPGG